MITRIYNSGSISLNANISKISIITAINPGFNSVVGSIDRDLVFFQNMGSFYINKDKRVKTRVELEIKGVADIAVTYSKENEKEQRELKGYSRLNRVNKLFFKA